MKPKNDDDLDGPGREFSLPSEIVKVPRLARVNMRQVTSHKVDDADSSEAPPMDFGRYLHALRRNWLLGTILGIICSGPIAALMWKLSPFEYTAVEYLRVAPSHVPLVFETMADQGARTEARSFKSTQRQLLLQPLSLNKALKESGVAQSPIIREMQNPITFLQKNIKVVFPEESEIMNVSLTLPDGNVAHKIVKAVVDTYMAEVVDKEKSERAYRIERLEKILAESKEKVRKKLNELSNTVEQLGTGDSMTLNLAQQNVLQQFGFLRGELSRIKVEVMRVRGELESRGFFNKSDGSKTEEKSAKTPDSPPGGEPAEGNPSSVATDQSPGTKSSDTKDSKDPMAGITDPFLLENIESDPVSSQLNQTITQLTKKIEQAKKRYDPKMAEPYVKKYQDQMIEAQGKLADRIKRIKQMSAAPGSTSGNQTEELLMKLKILEKQQAQIQGEMDALEVESKKFGKSSIDVEMKRKEIGGLDPVVDKVSQEIERTKIEMQSAPRVYLFPTMGAPTTGENKKRLPMTAAGGAAGLLFPILLLVLLDSRKNHVNNLGTINNGLKLNVLGSIPRIPNRLMRRLNDPADSVSVAWRERIAESMSAVTAMLLRKLANEGHRVIMVTSATAGEGKSTLCEQLARSLANSGHRTLVIDFDLRRPNLHLRFDAPLEPGVTEVLRHGADLIQTIRQTDLPNLGLLSAGNCMGSLLLESANGTLEALFNQCRTEYELVLVDSSPLLPVVDGRIVGQHTDGAILTIVKDRSQVPQIMAARKILDDYDISVLGCVFTGDKGDGYYGGGSTYGSYGRLPGKQGNVDSTTDAIRPTNAM